MGEAENQIFTSSQVVVERGRKRKINSIAPFVAHKNLVDLDRSGQKHGHVMLQQKQEREHSSSVKK